jgi:nicotinic acid mononucleotide adenylyltransferase
MNPPTPGHLLLIKKLIEEAIRQNVPKIYVILSKTNDNNENPIDCQEKINILGENVDDMNNMVLGLKKQMKTELERQELEPVILENTRSKIDRIEVIFLCVRPDQPSPIFPLYDIVRQYSNVPDLNLFIIVGDDRADFLDTIADSFLFKNENIHSVNGQILAREDMDSFKRLSPQELSRVTIEEMPVSAFSASFVRKLVKLGMKDKFDDVYRPYLAQEKIDHLYEIISQGLSKPDPTSKSSTIKPQKYTYPIVRGDEQFNEIIQIIS